MISVYIITTSLFKKKTCLTQNLYCALKLSSIQAQQTVSKQGKTEFMGSTCTLLYLAVVCAVAALEKLVVKGNLDAFGWNSVAGVLHVVRVLAVDGVDTGNGHFLLAVRQIFDVTERLKRMLKVRAP